MRWWKILGLAGLAGVAASGAVTVHAERRRRAYTPDEIRARLHERVAESAGDATAASPSTPTSTADAGADPDPAGADGPTGAGRRRPRWLGALVARVGRLRGRR